MQSIDGNNTAGIKYSKWNAGLHFKVAEVQRAGLDLTRVTVHRRGNVLHSVLHLREKVMGPGVVQ